MEQGILFKITMVTVGAPKVMIITPGGRGWGRGGEMVQMVKANTFKSAFTAEVNRRLKTSKLRNIKKSTLFRVRNNYQIKQ